MSNDERASDEKAVSDGTRRRLLGALGVGTLGIGSGCLRLSSGSENDSSGDEPTATGVPTTSPTARPTEEPTATPGEDTPEETPEDTPEETPEDTPEDEPTDSPPVEVTIGMVQPLTGALAPYGEIAARAFFTYFGYATGDTSVMPREIGNGVTEATVGDTTYVVDLRDTAGSASEAQVQARELAEDSDVLVGGSSSASALAIAENVASRAGIPYVAGPAASVALTNETRNCGEYVFRASETVAMDAATGGNYIGNSTGIERVYIFYADYSFGQAIRENYERVLGANGVEVVGTQALPQGYADDWPGQFQRAVDAGAGAVIGGFSVATLPAMLSAYLANDYDFRFMAGFGTRLGAGAIGSVLQERLGSLTSESIRNAGVGPFTTRYHWNQYDNDITTRANEHHIEQYGTNLDLFSSGMFTAASAIDQAVQAGGSADAADITTELTGMRVEETLKGAGGYQFQEYNNQARSAMTVAPLVPTEDKGRWDAPIQPGQPLARYDMDETTRSPGITDCSLR